MGPEGGLGGVPSGAAGGLGVVPRASTYRPSALTGKASRYR